MRSALELPAVARGTAVAVALSLPASLLGLVVVDGDRSTTLVFAFLLLVLAGLAVGGYVAARRAPSAPLVTGAVTALAAFVLIQSVGILRRLVAGESLSLQSLAFAAFLAYCCGLLGGAVASWRRPSVS